MSCALDGFHTIWVTPAGRHRPYRLYMRSPGTRAPPKQQKYNDGRCAYPDVEAREGRVFSGTFTKGTIMKKPAAKRWGPAILALGIASGSICLTAETAFASSTKHKVEAPARSRK